MENDVRESALSKAAGGRKSLAGRKGESVASGTIGLTQKEIDSTRNTISEQSERSLKGEHDGMISKVQFERDVSAFDLEHSVKGSHERIPVSQFLQKKNEGKSPMPRIRRATVYPNIKAGGIDLDYIEKVCTCYLHCRYKLQRRDFQSQRLNLRKKRNEKPRRYITKCYR